MIIHRAALELGCYLAIVLMPVDTLLAGHQNVGERFGLALANSQYPNP